MKGTSLWNKIYRWRLPPQFDVQQMGLFMQGRCHQHWAHPLRVWSIFSGNCVPTHKTVVSTQSLRTLCFQSMEGKTKCGQLIGSFFPRRGGEHSNIDALRSTNTSPHPGPNHGYDSEGWYRSPYRSQTELELRIWGDYTQTITDACRPAQGSHSLRDMLPVLDHLLQELCTESHLENKHGQHMQNIVYMICILSLELYCFLHQQVFRLTTSYSAKYLFQGWILACWVPNMLDHPSNQNSLCSSNKLTRSTAGGGRIFTSTINKKQCLQRETRI